jgi:uncharacterized protein (DUF433 family)
VTNVSDKILDMRDAGMTPKQIAEKIDMDQTDVNRAIWRARKRRAKQAGEVVEG